VGLKREEEDAGEYLDDAVDEAVVDLGVRGLVHEAGADHVSDNREWRMFE
jgi:hypothetical protein